MHAMQPKAKSATLYRMVMAGHVCPYGLKARHLLRAKGYRVDDHWLRTREETDAFKRERGVATTPQVFIEGKRIGGYGRSAPPVRQGAAHSGREPAIAR